MTNRLKTSNDETKNEFINQFFKDINPDEFKSYLFNLTSDAMLGCQEDSRNLNSNRISMLEKTINLIENLNKFYNNAN